MATLTITKELDLLYKYEVLLEEVLSADSIYIRTKETLGELISKGDMTSADSAKVISEVLSNLNTSLVNTTMGTALEWAKSEKGIELQLEELKYNVDILAQKILIDKAAKDKIDSEIAWGNAQSNKVFGAGGKTDKEIELMAQQILSAQEETKLMANKVLESQAGVYKITADTLANFGNATYSITNSGVSGTVQIGNGKLGDSQVAIARNQAAGYVYNAWSNAAQSAASVAAMEATEGAGTSGAGYTAFKTAVGNLLNTSL